MSGINGTVTTVPQGLPPGSYPGQPSLVTTNALRPRKGMQPASNSFVPANIHAVAHALVSPGMWKDSVAAVYEDTRNPFQFTAGEGAVWATTGPDHVGTPALMTPITMSGRTH